MVLGWLIAACTRLFQFFKGVIDALAPHKPSSSEKEITTRASASQNVTYRPPSENVDHQEVQELVESDLPKTQPVYTSKGNVRLFALLIGINVYVEKEITNLRGAVADSYAVKEFLTDVAGIPSDHIQHLVDDQATSDAIKSAIKAFATDGRIHYGDAILIYYAGHGSEANAPDSWPSHARNKVQMILPHDFVFVGQDSPNGQGIVDRSFAVLLHKIAKEKGENITVILDSCYSGSGTRDTPLDATTLSRGIELPADYKIYAQIDQDLVSAHIEEDTRSSVVATNFTQTGLTSHVLLAACREDEKARESYGRGSFTTALLNTLRHVGFDKITYNDLILRLPDLTQQQHPQCEGVHRTRFLFNSLVPSPRKPFYSIDIEPNRYIIHAGEALGVSVGAEFTIYQSPDSDSKPLEKLYVASSFAFTSVLRSRDQDPSFVLANPSFALETRRGDDEPAVRIVVKADFLQDLHLSPEECSRMDEGLRGIMFVEDRKGADLALQLNEKSVGFEILDKACVDHGLTHTHRRPRRSNEDIFIALRGAYHFYFHLRRSNKQGKIASKVTLECTKVINTELDGLPVTVPCGENLNKDGLIEIIIDDDDLEPLPYGFKVTSAHSQLPLYVSVFYFDNTDLSISSYFRPQSARNVVPPLPSGGSIAIGYGSSETPPYLYEISPGQNFDVGFLKLFLSTQHVDYTTVEQSSPFDEREDGTRYGRQMTTRAANLWDSTIVTIAQRRKLLR